MEPIISQVGRCRLHQKDEVVPASKIRPSEGRSPYPASGVLRDRRAAAPGRPKQGPTLGGPLAVPGERGAPGRAGRRAGPPQARPGPLVCFINEGNLMLKHSGAARWNLWGDWLGGFGCLVMQSLFLQAPARPPEAPTVPRPRWSGISGGGFASVCTARFPLEPRARLRAVGRACTSVRCQARTVTRTHFASCKDGI
jgi:hypothetical protein